MIKCFTFENFKSFEKAELDIEALTTLIVIVLVGTVGYGILWLMGESIKKELAYFRFYFPWKLFIILAIVLLIVTIEIAELIYHQTKKGSIAERLRFNLE